MVGIQRFLFAILLFTFCLAPYRTLAQGYDIQDVGTISGSLQSDIQTYTKDSLIGAAEVPERVLSNTFVNLRFVRGKFTAGLRYESYQNPLLGIDPRYGTSGAGTGIGIPFRFATYADDVFEVTAGNFYEQFGSGMVLRTYEERNLGFDNSIDGLLMKFMPTDGMKITALIGKQRAFFDVSAGVMRGGDLSLDLNQLAGGVLAEGMRGTLGLSAISRYQEDKNPFLNLPQNVFAWSARAGLGFHDFMMDVEYAYKINDPGAANLLSYNTGNALYLNMSYAIQGFGLNVSGKRIDNMDLRSDRTASGLVQQVNYLPALTKQHTWRLITLYPYATQQTGEFGLQGDMTFTIPKGGFLGDDETTVSVNASIIHELDTTHIDQYHYDAKFMWSNRVYYRDVNVEVIRKFGRKFKVTASFIGLQYDQDIIERRAAPDEFKYGVISANFAVLELWFATARGQALRTEFQYMAVSHQEGAQLALQNGDWAMILAEYSISPSWFFTVFDEYNFGNADKELQAHYPNVAVAFTTGALRLQGGYGRVRGGILCVGGICRPVPASNGFTLNTTYTF